MIGWKRAALAVSGVPWRWPSCVVKAKESIQETARRRLRLVQGRPAGVCC
jgi:hypothetical protein